MIKIYIVMLSVLFLVAALSGGFILFMENILGPHLDNGYWFFGSIFFTIFMVLNVSFLIAALSEKYGQSFSDWLKK